MKLWILEPLNDMSGPWLPWYDKAFGFVVCASDEARARQLASESAGAEKSRAWLDTELSTCVPLEPTEEPCVIMCDFHSA